MEEATSSLWRCSFFIRLFHRSSQCMSPLRLDALLLFIFTLALTYPLLLSTPSLRLSDLPLQALNTNRGIHSEIFFTVPSHFSALFLGIHVSLLHSTMYWVTRLKQFIHRWYVQAQLCLKVIAPVAIQNVNKSRTETKFSVFFFQTGRSLHWNFCNEILKLLKFLFNFLTMRKNFFFYQILYRFYTFSLCSL